MLGSFNNWNIITFSEKNTTSEDFKNIYQVVLVDSDQGNAQNVNPNRLVR